MSGPETDSSSAVEFPVVGIGASAGGLEAFQKFFEAMPADSGMAFVLVAHLAPTHVSLLPELIQRQTGMPVQAVVDGTRVHRDQVYVIPPNRGLTLSHGVLHLEEIRHPGRPNLPIDAFFRSLAEDQGSSAVGVILSGTGSDGTLGVRALKEHGGLVVVQEEESAKHGGMPRSAWSTGLVDYLLRPEEMPAQILAYVGHKVSDGRGRSVDGQPMALPTMQTILHYLRAKTGHDFTRYKTATVARRIQRRLQLHQIDDLNEYARYLRKSEREVKSLFKDLLIGVTGFFRDPEAFDVLRQKVLPKIMEAKPDAHTFRAWVPGCSTGEEAYSVAILLHEVMELRGERRRVQIFGTDLDPDAIEQARRGLYPANISADVSRERLERCFLPEDNGLLRIRKHLREMVAFAVQDINKDPPFTKLDLISCRNLMIYLGPELQERLISLFHFGLDPGGVLFLGSSESVGVSGPLFQAVDTRWKIYSRSAGRQRAGIPPLLSALPPDSLKVARGVRVPALHQEESDTVKVVEAILKQSDLPPCVVADADQNVVFVHGKVGRYLEPAAGPASMNLPAMARYGLKTALTSALLEAKQSRREVVVEDARVRHDDGYVPVTVKVTPVSDPGSFRGLHIVSFTEASTGPDGTPRGVGGSDESSEAEDLRVELQIAVEDLQTFREEMETSNEELQSLNEELQSANEELQSANEELETSQEELQSLHEEAETVNAELQARIDELAAANNDLKNLLDSTQIATLFLDIDLRVRRFTPSAAKVLPLAAGDVGRPVSDLAPNLEDVDLSGYAEKVLDSLVPQEVPVTGKGGEEYLLRITPYRTVSNVIDGVVMTFQERY